MLKALSQQCDAGYHWSDAWGGCVLDNPDIVIDVPGGGGSVLPNPPEGFLKYAFIGLGALLLLGAFAGGRASGRRSASKGRLLRRTTTRSIFG